MQPVSHEVYFREFDPAGNDSLSKLAGRITPGTNVLDVGCGPGVLGAYLATLGCLVDGIERSQSAAKLAAEKLRRVIVADLEVESLTSHLLDQRYDYVICADVLEHLRRPELLLSQLPRLLTSTGRVLLSIPNVAYAGLVGALINGDFRYQPDGLLDVTHLRFFTRRSLEELVADCGFKIVHTDAVTVPINESEFAADGIEALPPTVLRTLLAQRDALAYQFIFEIVPADGRCSDRTDHDAGRGAFSFVAQLHYRSDGPFDSEHVSTLHGAMGVQRQTLRFELPPSSSGFTALRLDPSNRPGYLRLFGMTLVDARGEVAWRWRAEQTLDSERANEIHVVEETEAALLILAGDDPWIELPIPQAMLRALSDGGALEVELAWPQPIDSFTVLHRLFDDAADGQGGGEMVRLSADVRVLRREVEALREQLCSERHAVAVLRRWLTTRLERRVQAIVKRIRRGL